MLAPAKVNLYLHVTGKRSDGMHLLESLVIFTAFGDHITAKPARELSLSISGEMASALGGAKPAADAGAQENLVLKAARLLQSHYAISDGAALHLEKRIPVGAGLGGGSADAAAALKLLNVLWDINASLEALAALAAPLGSDIPACLYAAPLHMSGAGEVITLLPDWQMPHEILLVNPRLPICTGEAYRRFAANPSYHAPLAREQWLAFEQAGNDLTQAAHEICPSTREVLKEIEALEGCILARLCGSGATCFGLFDHAEPAARALLRSHPHWWVMPTLPYVKAKA